MFGWLHQLNPMYHALMVLHSFVGTMTEEITPLLTTKYHKDLAAVQRLRAHIVLLMLELHDRTTFASAAEMDETRERRRATAHGLASIDFPRDWVD